MDLKAAEVPDRGEHTGGRSLWDQHRVVALNIRLQDLFKKKNNLLLQETGAPYTFFTACVNMQHELQFTS